MNKLKKSGPFDENGATSRAKPTQHPANGHAQMAVASASEWTYPSSETFFKPNAFRLTRGPSRKRKRRSYADYRELMALESQARKLNFLAPDSARSLPTGPQIQQLHERALPFETNGNHSANGSSTPHSTLEMPAFSPVQQPGILIVDQRMNMFYGSRRNLKSVVAANAAALLAWRMLAQGKRLGAIVFNDKKIVQMQPGCSRLQALLILQTVLHQNHGLQSSGGIYSNPSMLNDALRRANKISDSPLVFLITDASGHDRETFRLATDISQRSDLVVILVYDPRQAKLCNTTRRQQSLAGQFFPDGVPVIPLNTQNDVAYQLKHSYIKSALATFAKIRRSRAGTVPLEAQLA